METKHVFQNWILTLVIGSVLLPIPLGVMHGGLNNVYQAYTQELYIVPMAAIIGLIASTPSLITLFIAKLVIQQARLKPTCTIGLLWVLNTFFILITLLVIIGNQPHDLREVFSISLPYLMTNSVFYAYHRFKPYRKPQVLNSPI